MNTIKQELIKLAEEMESLADEIAEEEARLEKTASETLRDFTLGNVGTVPGRTGNPLLDFLTN